MNAEATPAAELLAQHDVDALMFELIDRERRRRSRHINHTLTKYRRRYARRHGQ